MKVHKAEEAVFFWLNNRVVKQPGDMALSSSKEWTSRQKLLFLCLTVALMYLFLYSKLSPVAFNFRRLAGNDSESRFPQIRPYTTTGPPNKTAITDTSITLFVRMSGSRQDHLFRFYCHLYRTFVLYWPPSLGKFVIVLDKEREDDHKFSAKLSSETKSYFPDYKIEVLYEPLPQRDDILNIKGHPRGYNRQLWSSFFIDQYTNDSIIAWMDSDTAFLTPVTKSTIFAGTKLRAIATQPEITSFRFWVKHWVATNEIALGLPFVADFMTYFPVYIYRDTFTHCREYILKRFNSTDLEEVFPKFFETNGTERLELSPVNIVLNYAWYFERDRYDWSFEITRNLTEYNEEFLKGYAIGPEYLRTILAEPQTAFHSMKTKGMWIWSKILISYCLSHRAAGNTTVDICTNHMPNAAFKDNFPLFNYDLQFITNPLRSPCNAGNNSFTCLRILERHYNQVGLEIKQGRKLEWRNIETVEQIAKNSGITCNPIYN